MTWDVKPIRMDRPDERKVRLRIYIFWRSMPCGQLRVEDTILLILSYTTLPGEYTESPLNRTKYDGYV